VAVCHVLRYAPYFVKLRDVMLSGAIGRVVSLQHFEPIQHVHMAHSFVRGNWHDSVATAPIILAKSSHDLDMLRWLVDRPSRQIQAFGDLSWFHAGNAPAGSTPRCMDGCAVEAECPYSALRIYHRTGAGSTSSTSRTTG
jgi:predicted dehydrogenase